MAMNLLYHYVNTTEKSGRAERHLLLENYPALLRPDWLPSPRDWPEFADLRAEHERLLAACESALRKAQETNAKFAAEDQRQHDEIEAAVREGRKEKQVKRTP